MKAMVDVIRFYLRVFAGLNEIIQMSDTTRYVFNQISGHVIFLKEIWPLPGSMPFF